MCYHWLFGRSCFSVSLSIFPYFCHSLLLSLSLSLSLSISSISFSFSVSLPICLSISQSLCLSLFTGDYPTSQSAQQNKSKAVKVGNLFWGPRTWAGVLNFVKFLHINVAGKDKNDLKIIEKIVKDLGISNQKKIRFNFNETIDRGAFSGASASRKAGERRQGSVLYCPAIYCTLLYCSVLDYALLYYTALYPYCYYTVLYLYWSVQCSAVSCNLLYSTLLFCTGLWFTVLYCTVPILLLYCTISILDFAV